jgi:carboxypeptidase D
MYNLGAPAQSTLSGAGEQGFQKPLLKDSFIVDNVGALGNMQSERGLTYVEVALSGHM